MQTFYQLLSIEATATAEEIKKAFRSEIARYHPDKVQHLGKEFQEMAATRAAQLTEAYRTLMSPELRSEYDRLCGSAAGTPASPPAAAQASPPRQAPSQTPSAAPPLQSEPATGAAAPPLRFAKEQATGEEVVRKATLARLRQALGREYASLVEASTKGFDFDCAAKPKTLFGRGGTRRFAVKFVPRVDRAAVQDAWNVAQKAGGQICVLLMGNGLAPASDLSDAISELRKRSRGDNGVCIIPIDVRDWNAHIPVDAPPACKSVVQKLRDVSA